jgi:hypothetical protein
MKSFTKVTFILKLTSGKGKDPETNLHTVYRTYSVQWGKKRGCRNYASVRVWKWALRHRCSKLECFWMHVGSIICGFFCVV